jgi:hypothetical protein
MSERSSALGRYLRARVARKLLARVGLAKLAAAGAVALGAFLAFLVLLAAIAGASSSAEEEQPGTCSVVTTRSSGGVKSPPARLVPLYAEAAQKYRLGPRGASILAAINYVESDYGESPLPGVRSGSNYAGAAGPMQFLYPSSWEAFGVDGNGDGEKNVYDPADAIFAAANLLHAAGAPGDWYGAIFSYNHADWYVRKVERIAAGFGPIQCTGQPTTTVQRLLYVAGWIEAQKVHYCWGGGHGPSPGPSTGYYCYTAAGQQVFGTATRGLDCSGAVRWLLVLSGFPDPGQLTSGEFATAYPSGPGAAVTIWSNAEHVFIDIDGEDWGTSASNFASGPGFADHTTAGFAPSHPEGL